MTEEEYEQEQEEQSFLAYQSNYRRMWEEGERAGYARGRAEMMCRIYEQEPLYTPEEDLYLTNGAEPEMVERARIARLEAIDCPF